jgi:hypothetical protein
MVGQPASSQFSQSPQKSYTQLNLYDQPEGWLNFG